VSTKHIVFIIDLKLFLQSILKTYGFKIGIHY